MFKLYRLKNYNFRLIIWLLMISGIGVLLVGSAKASLQSRQLIGVILGLVVMVVVSLMDYSWLLNFYWIIYGVNIIMLLIVRSSGILQVVLPDGWILALYDFSRPSFRRSC